MRFPIYPAARHLEPLALPDTPMEVGELTVRSWRDEMRMQQIFEVSYNDGSGPTRSAKIQVADEVLLRAVTVDDARDTQVEAVRSAALELGVDPRVLEEFLAHEMHRESLLLFTASPRLALGTRSLAEAVARSGIAAHEAAERFRVAMQGLSAAAQVWHPYASFEEADGLAPTHYGDIALFTAPCPGCGKDVTWQTKQGWDEEHPDEITIWDEDCCG